MKNGNPFKGGVPVRVKKLVDDHNKLIDLVNELIKDSDKGKAHVNEP